LVAEGRYVNLFRSLHSLPDRFRGGAISIGNFDGVHRGHAQIVARLRAMAQRIGGPALIFTFDPHPAKVLCPERSPEPLGWTQRNAELLTELGVDAVLAYPTDEAFLAVEAQEFFAKIVCGQLRARGMVEGRNFFFGHRRSGTIELLGELCRAADMPLDVVDPLEVDGAVVSSSRIRTLVAAGRMREACELLGHPYRIHGPVIHGRRRGNRLGFPTANLTPTNMLLPKEGIYAGRGHVDGTAYPAAISIGPNPTFDEGALKIEAYLLDYQGPDFYDQPIAIDFLAELREIIRFASVDELVAQMAEDVETTRRIAGERS
jgi:riboflavin kinase / FMN adenylyltransferase